MDIIIGSARVDEKGGYTGGAAGDQKQTSTPDRSGEVSMQPFYLHKKGWIIIRLKDPAQARKMAIAVERGCNNPNLGYSMLSDRLGIVRESTSTKKPVNCDCSSLMRVCFREATGKDPGNFTTANEVATLEKTGLVEDPIPYTKGTPLYLGDILVTKSKGHTAAVVNAPERPKNAMADEDLTTRLAWDVIKGKAGTGWDARRAYITACGGNVAMVRAKVNELKKQGAF